MNINNLSLTINFNDIAELKEYINIIDELEMIKLKKIFKKCNPVVDKRGGQTKHYILKQKNIN